MERLEEELERLRNESRIGTIEYHIENLTVESIQNGILDLGVHMGNEMDKRIQTSGESKLQQTADEQQGELQQTAQQALEHRVLQVEADLLEVKDFIQGWEERMRKAEEQVTLLDQRLRKLEALHW